MKKEEDKRRWKRLAFESEPTNVSKRGLCVCVCVGGGGEWLLVVLVPLFLL